MNKVAATIIYSILTAINSFGIVNDPTQTFRRKLNSEDFIHQILRPHEWFYLVKEQKEKI